MKKLIYIALIPLLMFCSCSNGMQGSPAAVQAGAAIGGILGAVIGDRAGGYNGSQFGAIIGTVAGAAVGNAATTPKKDNGTDYDYYVPNESHAYQNNVAASPVTITNIRFIDSDRNHIINAGENAKIIFDITNDSDVAVYNVIPTIEISGIKNIIVSPSSQISYMEPGTTIRYTASLLATGRLKNGQANFNIYATESNGTVSNYHQFSLPTQKRVK